MSRFYLVRHAQTCWNRENRLQGHTDQPLSLLGVQQARRVAEFFSSIPLQGVVASGLQRTQQTAEIIVANQPSGPRLAIECDLNEIHLGVWEGLTPEEIDARFDQAYQRWRVTPSSVIIPAAEHLVAFRARVRQAFARLVSTVDEGTYAIVTHGGVIATLLADSLQADYDTILRRLRVDNAGITALEMSAAISSVLWINWTAHLEGLTPWLPAAPPGRNVLTASVADAGTCAA